MMEKFFAGLAGQFTGEVINDIAGAVGIPPEAAQSAVAAALPAIAGALAGKAAQPKGAADLMHTFGILTSMGSSQPKTMLSGLLNDPKAMHAGANMAKSLFGDQHGAIVGSLIEQAGVSEEAAGKLLGMAVPAVMGAIGTQAKMKGVDAAGLVAFFNEASKPEGHTVASSHPPAMSESPSSTDASAPEVASITESLKRGLKRLFGRD
jgi:hypothetical protein